jgi:uncharacterized membrane protein
MAARGIVLIVSAIAVIGLLAAFAVIIAANHGVEFVVPKFEL